VRIYVCGITPYDSTHLGHANTYLTYDLLVRRLEHLGHTVELVRNITDVDDSILPKARELGVDFLELAAAEMARFHGDMEALDTRPVDHEPRATDWIDAMISLIGDLDAKGHVYTVDGTTFFDVSTFASFGEVSGYDEATMVELARERGGHPDDPRQRHRLDFVLWQPSADDEPSWASPWGPGRPGWHIECSAMAMGLLGPTIDLHGGGSDLIFPHHECERAQSEAATGERFVNLWMHNGFVRINDEKMSKSLGNFFTVREILKRYQGEEIRYFVLASHYRSPLNFADQLLDSARAALTRLYNSLRGIEPATAVAGDSEYALRFEQAMDDDFNTPEAIAVLFELATHVNRARDQDNLAEAAELAAVLKRLANVLGLLEADPDSFLQGGTTADDSQTIEALVQQRLQARADKNWAEADRIRDQLHEMGIELEDKGGNTVWRRK
jgi:cysteinyl-tRNA synthetase